MVSVGGMGACGVTFFSSYYICEVGWYTVGGYTGGVVVWVCPGFFVFLCRFWLVCPIWRVLFLYFSTGLSIHFYSIVDKCIDNRVYGGECGMNQKIKLDDTDRHEVYTSKLRMPVKDRNSLVATIPMGVVQVLGLSAGDVMRYTLDVKAKDNTATINVEFLRVQDDEE